MLVVRKEATRPCVLAMDSGAFHTYLPGFKEGAGGCMAPAPCYGPHPPARAPNEYTNPSTKRKESGRNKQSKTHGKRAVTAASLATPAAPAALFSGSRGSILPQVCALSFLVPSEPLHPSCMMCESAEYYDPATPTRTAAQTAPIARTAPRDRVRARPSDSQGDY